MPGVPQTHREAKQRAVNSAVPFGSTRGCCFSSLVKNKQTTKTTTTKQNPKDAFGIYSLNAIRCSCHHLGLFSPWHIMYFLVDLLHVTTSGWNFAFFSDLVQETLVSFFSSSCEHTLSHTHLSSCFRFHAFFVPDDCEAYSWLGNAYLCLCSLKLQGGLGGTPSGCLPSC